MPPGRNRLPTKGNNTRNLPRQHHHSVAHAALYRNKSLAPSKFGARSFETVVGIDVTAAMKLFLVRSLTRSRLKPYSDYARECQIRYPKNLCGTVENLVSQLIAALLPGPFSSALLWLQSS